MTKTHHYRVIIINSTIISPILHRIKNVLLLLLFAVAVMHWSAPLLPTTGGVIDYSDPVPQTDLPGQDDFARQVQNGNPNQVVGLYVASLMAFPVVPQPSDQPGYVSTREDVVTKFSMADAYGSLGFLAHNYLTGSLFDDLQVGHIVHVIYGDGHSIPYEVRIISRYQATEPGSPYSNFIDQADGTLLTAADLFYQTYGLPGQLILQTCIAASGNASWGRLFVIATPVEAGFLVEPATRVNQLSLKYKLNTIQILD